MGLFEEIQIRGDERLQGTPESALHAPGAARDTAHFAESKGIKRDNPIRFSPLSTSQRDGGCLQESHSRVVYHEWSSAASRTTPHTKSCVIGKLLLYSGLHSVRYDTVQCLMKMSMPMHVLSRYRDFRMGAPYVEGDDCIRIHPLLSMPNGR
jgi:hypothetical protein